MLIGVPAEIPDSLSDDELIKRLVETWRQIRDPVVALVRVGYEVFAVINRDDNRVAALLVEGRKSRYPQYSSEKSAKKRNQRTTPR